MNYHSKINWGAKTWSPKEDEELKILYARRLPMIVLMNNLKVGEGYIRDRIKELGLTGKRSRVYTSFRTYYKPWKYKLDPLKAAQIRRMRASGKRIVDIAEKFGVSVDTISDVVNNKRWKEE